jgi:aminomethyltransferase
MKKTPLYNKHIEANGRMVEFAGFSMPVLYSSIIEEHLTVRNSVGLFDVSHMGEFIVKGDNAELFLSKLVPTAMSKLEPNKSMYTLLCLENGGVIDDLFIFMIEKNNYYLVVNASTIDKDWSWMNKHIMNGVELKNVSDTTSKIDIQGPDSLNVIKKIFNKDKLNNLERFYFYYDTFSGTEVMISNTGYTGERGYELYIDNAKAEALWDRLMLEGSEFNIKPSGLGARDTLRLEACYSLYGHEMNDEINPYEAGLGWLISSGADYIGKESLAQIKANGPKYELLCLELTGKGVLHEGYKVLYNGDEVGTLTSGIYSPSFKKGLALIRVKKGVLSKGDKVEVIIRDKGVEGIIVNRPFYKFNGVSSEGRINIRPFKD